MILIIKYLNESTTIFDTASDNGVPQPIDALLIDRVLDFPLFDIDTEIAGGIAERKAGEFSCAFSLLQTTTSYNGDTVNTFFRGGTRQYKYWIGIEVGGSTFHGVFSASDTEFNLTFKDGHYEVSLIARDTIEEWANYLKTLNSYFSISQSQNFTFEDYIRNIHLSGFTIDFPDQSFTNKVGEDVYFYGYAYVRGIRAGTDLRNVSRFESFNELSKGLGFTYDLSMRVDLETLYSGGSATWYPRTFMQVNIDWVWNGGTVSSNDMIISNVIEHKEKTLPKANRAVFLGYRHIISTALPDVDSPDFTAVRGVFFDGTNILESDSGDNFNPIYAQYPFFLFTENTFEVSTPFTSISVAPEQFAYFRSREDYDKFNYSEVNFIELKLYNYTTLSGTTTAGSCAFARVFTTNIGFSPIQRYVYNQYLRYVLSSGKKVKMVKIVLDTNELKVFKPVRLVDDYGEGIYYISKISNLNYRERTVDLELTQV